MEEGVAKVVGAEYTKENDSGKWSGLASLTQHYE
jgi:hypothetical protein